MKIKIIIYSIILLLVFSGCDKLWEDHYNSYPETVDENVWDAMKNDPDISQFVKLLTDKQLDTLFNTDIPYTIFAVKNGDIVDTTDISSNILEYHIASHFINSEVVNGIRKIRMLSEKYAMFNDTGADVELDGIPALFESPLYRNGKYFVLDKLSEPKPNLYEFFAENNPVLKNYIDSQDSVVLDMERSKPIGYNDDGKTVFDSVTDVYNLFEEEFFQVREEFRLKSATIVFPLKNDYETALTNMAQNIGNGYVDYNDIPEIWQQEILVPYLLENGVFENELEPDEFVVSTETKEMKMKNILGDSVVINYVPIGKSVCSNGYAYNYTNFEVPDSLYNRGSIYEMEELLDQTGVGKFGWIENVKIASDEPFQPEITFDRSASNDSILSVVFTDGYDGGYSVEFSTQYLFPQRYRLVVRTIMDVGGVYDIYINDELIRTFNYSEYQDYRGLIQSVTGEWFKPEGKFNNFDMYVDNIQDFQKARIKFQYKGPGAKVESNGFVIDYIEFVPVNN